MAPNLILGPLLRYAGETDATVWVGTDAACEVAEVRAGGASHRSPTFAVEGYHYALVRLRGLAPCATYPYTVVPDGEEVWPDFSPSAIRTMTAGEC